MYGTARLIKAFLIAYKGQPLRYFTNSMVCNAAMQLVVVDRAGMILPAFSLTLIHYISYNL